jgi:DMSO/TMAO reductase YedYZ heme-binding membrane subunit
MDRKFVLCGWGYAIAGMALGVFMGASKNHGEMVAHAHILLVGFVVSFIYALCHKLWLNNVRSGLAVAQFYIHQFGVAAMSVGLFLLYGGFIAPDVIDPVLGASSIAVLVGMVLMAILFAQSGKRL